MWRTSCRWVWLRLEVFLVQTVLLGWLWSLGSLLWRSSKLFDSKLCHHLLQDVSSRETGGEDLETVVTAVSRAPSKVTLSELLDTLRLLEEEPELLPPPKLFKKDKYTWVDGVRRGLGRVASVPGRASSLVGCGGQEGWETWLVPRHWVCWRR